MQPVHLRFDPAGHQPDLPLEMGMHHLGWTDGRLGMIPEGTGAMVCFRVDRRGVWLTVGEGVAGVHVNGREVRRLAMLRVGDSVYVDGHELTLVGSPPAATPQAAGQGPADLRNDPRIVLRGLGGRHHGRSITLDAPRLVGRAAGADIHIDDPAFAERHARVELADGQVLLRDLGSGEGSLVNGRRVRDAVLQPGDQVVFGAGTRFVVEAPMRAVRGGEPDGLAGGHAVPSADEAGRPGARSYWRLPLVLAAALLIAGLLSLLLLFGAG